MEDLSKKLHCKSVGMKTLIVGHFRGQRIEKELRFVRYRSNCVVETANRYTTSKPWETKIICEPELSRPSDENLLKFCGFYCSTAEVDSSGEHTSVNILVGNCFC